MDTMPDPINRFARFAHIVCSAALPSALAAQKLRIRTEPRPGPTAERGGRCKRADEWRDEDEGRQAAERSFTPVKNRPEFGSMCVNRAP